MNPIQRRLIGHSALFNRNGEVSGVAFDGLIERLLLFDGYVLKTVRFKEIPYLVRGLGYDQTLELLDSGLIQFRCEVTQIGSERDLELKRIKKPTFSLIWIEAHDWDKYVSDCLADVQADLLLPDAKWQQLRARIEKSIKRVEPSIRKEVALAFLDTLDRSPSILAESVRVAGKRRRIPLVFPGFETHVERSDDLIRAESDLRRISISQEELWEILRDGLMGVATMEQNIGEMKNFGGLGGFSPEELAIFEKKMAGLARLVYAEETQERITRIARVTGLPRFSPENMSLDVEKLMSIRESEELRVFRDWLATSDSLTDQDVRNLLRGYRAMVSSFVQTGSVTLTRLVVEAFVGLYHPVAGLTLAALDAFLIEKLFPRSGPAAFVNKSYPSLFPKRKG